ncbi:MAG: tripartite tricarboxylate transporter permease [Verrucomicrobiae bacterium]|nr:tripartite tricarboxylate transporter permease [Verrucomicrobiae bacterium]
MDYLPILLPWMLSMIFGVFVGATPGLTATMAVALIVPLSIQFDDPNAGLAMIIGVSFTAIFAGDIPATFLRIPGTPASAAATLDGHALAQKGLGEQALKLNLVCSALGGLIGVVILMLLAPQMAKFALKFSNFEYFWLAVFGLTMSATVSAGNTFKGMLAAGLGILISTVGIDNISGTARFTFKTAELSGGIQFIPVMIGLFGLSEVLRNARRDDGSTVSMTTPTQQPGSFLVAAKTMARRWRTVVQSAVTGTIIGALPGAGADVAAWAAYGLAKKTSKKPDTFGKGAEEGIIAPTSANNAAVAGAWIPALVFGIPGDAVTAIVLGAMLMYDLKPGPQIFVESPEKVKAIFSIALATQALLLVAGYCGIRAFRWVMRMPRQAVLTSVVVFSVVGAFSLNNRMFDVYVMVAAGLLGWFLDSQKVPIAPLILGLILGPLAEEKLRAGLIAEQGNLVPLFTRPICAILVTLLVLMLLGAIVNAVRNRRKKNQGDTTP